MHPNAAAHGPLTLAYVKVAMTVLFRFMRGEMGGRTRIYS